MASIACPRCGEPNSEFNQRCARCSTTLPLSTTQASDPKEPSPARALQDTPLVETNLSHYRVLREIGAGGMGRVYAAEDTKLGRVVALKVLPPPLAEEPGRLERFQREAKAIAALNHPNIVTLYSVEEAEGLHFLTMELVEGQPLDELIPEGGMKLDLLLDVALPLAAALGAAHKRGILHRDLKPANIMRSTEGVVKVLDFGLAKLWKEPGSGEGSQEPAKAAVAAVEALTSEVVTPASASKRHLLDRTTPLSKAMLTSQGRILGTLPYMSPEQLQGTSLDQRSDLFSLGIILFELATGRRPFEGKSAAALISSILRDPAPPLAGLRPDLPKALVKILERCLAKDPGQRFQTARDLLDAVRALRTGKRPRNAYRGVALAAAFAGIAAAILRFNPAAPTRGVTEKTTHRASALVTWPSEESEGRISPDMRWISFISDRSGRRSIWLQRLDEGEAHPLALQSEGEITSHVWSPDGKEIAYLVYRGMEPVLEIAASTGGGARMRKALGVPVQELTRWVETRIYFTGDDSPWRFDVEAGTLDRVFDDPELRVVWGADVSADEKQVVFVSQRDRQPDLWTGDLSGENLVRLADDPYREFYPRWLGRQTSIVYASDRSGEINLWRKSLEDGLSTQLTAGTAQDLVTDVSPDGRLLTFQRFLEMAHVYSLDLQTGRDIQLTADSLQDFWPSAGNQVIAFQRRDPDPRVGSFHGEAQVYLLNRRDAAASLARRLVKDGFWPRVSPNGRWLAHLKMPSDGNGGANPADPPEIWLHDLGTDRSRRIGRSYAGSDFEPFPLGWIARNLVWSGDSEAIYFVVRTSAGIAEIRRVRPDHEQAEPELVLSANAAGVLLQEPLLSEDHRTLVHVRREPKPGGAWKVVEKDLASGTQRTLFEQSMPPHGALRIAGWRDPRRLVLLAWQRNADDTARVTVLELDVEGGKEVLGVAEHAFIGTAVLDSTAEALYVTCVENKIHNLFAFSLRERAWRRLTRNNSPGTTISGVETLSQNELLYVRQSRNRDLWLLRFDGPP